MNLAITELFNPIIHGKEPLMDSHYLMTYKISLDDFMCNEYKCILSKMRDQYDNYVKKIDNENNNSIVNNYNKIIDMVKYYSLQIVEPIMRNDVTSCIIKTYALSIFQRKWKNYMSNK